MQAAPTKKPKNKCKSHITHRWASFSFTDCWQIVIFTTNYAFWKTIMAKYAADKIDRIESVIWLNHVFLLFILYIVVSRDFSRLTSLVLFMGEVVGILLWCFFFFMNYLLYYVQHQYNLSFNILLSIYLVIIVINMYISLVWWYFFCFCL